MIRVRPVPVISAFRPGIWVFPRDIWASQPGISAFPPDTLVPPSAERSRKRSNNRFPAIELEGPCPMGQGSFFMVAELARAALLMLGQATVATSR